MQIKLYHAVQENTYYFKGYAALNEVAQLFSGYQFSEDTLEKAAIHKKNMAYGISPFTAVLRLNPDSSVERSEESLLFTSEQCQICNGASKIAAICQLSPEQLQDTLLSLNVFLLTEEKMRTITG